MRASGSGDPRSIEEAFPILYPENKSGLIHLNHPHIKSGAINTKDAVMYRVWEFFRLKKSGLRNPDTNRLKNQTKINM